MAKYQRKRQDPGYEEACQIVRKRDKNTCQMPGCKRKRKIEVHHIQRYANNPYLRIEPMNMICLCKDHHKEITGKEEYFVMLFTDIVHDNTK